MSNIRNINLNQLAIEDYFILGKLFSSHKNIIDVFKKNHEFRVFYDNKVYVVTLNHDVVHRPRNSNQLEDRYEVIDTKNKIGEGGFSKIYSVLYTLVPQENESVYIKNNKERVVKVQMHSNDELHQLDNEFIISKQAGNLHIKKPALIGAPCSHSMSYTVMKRLKGKELLDVINDSYNKKIYLSPLKRFVICIKLLTELKKLHEAGIIHRDIKPENIMFDLQSGELNYIDYGLSKIVGMTDLPGCEAVGTLRYAPPEIYIGKSLTEKSDIFSLAIVLGLIWGAELPTEKQIYDSTYRFNGIFHDDTILKDEEKNRIKKVLLGMAVHSPNKRTSISSALEELQAVYQKVLTRLSKLKQPLGCSLFYSSKRHPEDEQPDWGHTFKR